MLNTAPVSLKTDIANQDDHHGNIAQLFDNGHIETIVRELCDHGYRLSVSDALYLYQHPNLLRLGELAFRVCARREGDRVFYNLNRHINPTNICIYSCKFCSYAKKPQDEGAYAYSIAEIVAKTRQASEEGVDEIHMVGGLHPRWNLAHFLKILRAVKKEAP
ncbi:MAG: hypothetical protein OXC40_00220, partial [Proteobacteria bacterium]|nr:hypothetical protein [Pseudomonadota bacterium]